LTQVSASKSKVYWKSWPIRAKFDQKVVVYE
jgi:hypothetical protein